MHGLTIVKSLLVRVFLLAHGLVCTWRVIDTNDNQYYWIILIGLGCLLIETGIVIWLRNGHELKTVAFCIIFYLTCAIPALWIIHVETANTKLFYLAEHKLNARATVPSIQSRQLNPMPNTTLSLALLFPPASSNNSLPSSSIAAQVAVHTTPMIISIGHVECHDKAWYHMDEQRWLDAIQETMLLMLCIVRLLISREHMTVSKSGIVLLISLINSADLLAMSHTLQYHDVIIERLWMYMGLVLLSMGLFQMSFIDTDGLTAFTSQLGLSNEKKRRFSKRIHFLQDQNICPLFRALFINDGLLLLYRTLLATKVRCSKPTIIFFMAKNVLIISLHCYRVYHLSKERQKKKTFAAYEQLLKPSPTLRKYRHPFYDFERDYSKRRYQDLLHRTINRPMSMTHRRKSKSPRILNSSSNDSISYPFARRRHDGGRSRTAFALYGLPFRTPQIPRPATVSSSASLVAKAFVH